jgi:hypothetical protein
MLARNTAIKKAVLSGLRSVGGKRHFVSNSKSSPSSSSGLALHHRSARSALSVTSRQSSSAAARDDAEDHGPPKGYAAEAAVRMNTLKSHEEAWMINLGRRRENAWLTGPRSDEWFTGVVPSKCPGKSIDTMTLTREIQYNNIVIVVLDHGNLFRRN